MFYLHQDEIGRLFIQNDNYGNFKPIYSSAPKMGIDENFEWLTKKKTLEALVERLNKSVENKIYPTILHDENNYEIYVRWSNEPWAPWSLEISNRYKLEKVLIGYKQPYSFKSEEWNINKNSIWVKHDSKRQKEQNQYRLKNYDPNSFRLLPAEIVESWEPVYEETKSIELSKYEIRCMLGLSNTNIDIKLKK